MIVIGVILLCIFIVYAPPILYETKGWFKLFFHDILGWHKPEIVESFDGCSLHTHCKYCGKSIMEDSQGNWF